MKPEKFTRFFGKFYSMTRILAFGDSFTFGAWDPEGGWVQRLKKFLTLRTMETEEEEVHFQVYNLGVSGDISESLLERLESELDRDRAMMKP